MHLAGRGFPACTRATALGVDGWRPLWEDVARPEPTRSSRALPTKSMPTSPRWKRTGRTSLPAGVIHADLFPDNVFFLGDRLSGLIDFYFACNDLLAYDVAVCLNAWCFERDHSFNLTKGMALLDGYTGVRPLSAAEAEALPVLAHGAALRFMLTRLLRLADRSRRQRSW